MRRGWEGRPSGPLRHGPHPAAFFVGYAVYVLYLDDSGSPTNANEEHFVLGGVCVFERQIHWIGKAVEELVESLPVGDPAEIELHASPLRAGRNRWRSLDRQDRQEIFRKVCHIVAKAHESTRLFAVAVHKPSCTPENPVELAFEHICMRFDKYLGRLYRRNSDPHRGIIILDKSTYETPLQRLTREFRSFGHRWGVLRNITEVPLFVDSRSTRLIQLADIVAHVVWRRYEKHDPLDLELMRILLPRFDRDGGAIHGLAHLHNHKLDCHCPACDPSQVNW